MFGVLEYPPFGYRHAYEPIFCTRCYRSRNSPFESYVTNVQRQLERILYDGLLDLVEKHAKPEKKEEAPAAQGNDSLNEEKEVREEQEEQEEPQSQSFFFSSSVTRQRGGGADGKSERVEEHRERVMAGDGSVHTVTRRQIGDRWYVHESHSTKDGESSSKETWHNVPEEAIESFKREWEDRHALKDDKQQALE